MKKTIFRLPAILISILSMLFLTQCDILIGSGERANVGIDLSGFYGQGRAIGMPSGTEMTSIRVSVFGPGMQRIEKTVSAGTRYINMYVPAGQQRYFTLDIFFNIPQQSQYGFPHVRSFRGRAEADLRPGYFVGLIFSMDSGITSLLVVDNKRNGGAGRIYHAETISTSSFTEALFGSGTRMDPYDLEIASDGRIFVANSSNIYYNNDLDNPNPFVMGNINATALAMDRACFFDINDSQDGNYETNLLYYNSGTSIGYLILGTSQQGHVEPTIYGPNGMNPPGLSSIAGMSVDPWTHRLYLVGVDSATRNQCIVEYEPLYTETRTPGRIIGQPVTHPDFRTLRDIIVKDDGIYVLNEVPTNEAPQLPIIMKFDHNLNYLESFGTVSTEFNQGQGVWMLVESVDPGKFYRPKRFFAQENDGLYIIDDSPNTYTFDKVVYIDENLNPSSWRTYPPTTGGDIFDFFD